MKRPLHEKKRIGSSNTSPDDTPMGELILQQAEDAQTHVIRILPGAGDAA